MKTILAALNQKGGCGKTTLAVNLAGLPPGDVAVINADPQDSASGADFMGCLMGGAGSDCW